MDFNWLLKELTEFIAVSDTSIGFQKDQCIHPYCDLFIMKRKHLSPGLGQKSQIPVLEDEAENSINSISM